MTDDQQRAPDLDPSHARGRPSHRRPRRGAGQRFSRVDRGDPPAARGRPDRRRTPRPKPHPASRRPPHGRETFLEREGFGYAPRSSGSAPAAGRCSPPSRRRRRPSAAVGSRLYCFAPLTSPRNAVAFGALREQAERARLFCDEHGQKTGPARSRRSAHACRPPSASCAQRLPPVTPPCPAASTTGMTRFARAARQSRTPCTNDARTVGEVGNYQPRQQPWASERQHIASGTV